MIVVKHTPTNRAVFVINEPGITATKYVMLTEEELDDLQQRIMQVKADLYKERQEIKGLPDYPCCTD